MKIIRISSPLPLDVIPTELGEDLVDQNLDEYTIQQLDEEYGFRNHLGGGCWGTAYSTFDDRVVKITTDKEEVDASRSLIGDTWQRHAPFARVYEVKELEGLDLFVVVKELVKPLSEYEQSLFNIFFEAFEGDTENIEEEELKEYAQILPLFKKFEEYHYDVSNYAMKDTYNTGNLGWNKDGKLVVFDPQIQN